MTKLLRIKKNFLNRRLSKGKFSINTFSIVFIGFLTVISSCQEEVAEPIVAAVLENIPIDDRILGNEAVIRHMNPETGALYTAEELAALSYDPTKEENYKPGSDFSMDIVMKLEASKVEVLIGDNESLKELDISTINQDNDYIATFSSNFDNLGFDRGEVRVLSFVITYNNASEGKTASVQTLNFKFNMADIKPRALAFLKKQNGDVIELKTTVTGAKREEDDTYGHIFTFDENEDDYMTIINTDDLSFRYTDSFTASIWIKTTSERDDPVIIGDEDWSDGNLKGFLFSQTGSTWLLNIADGGTKRIKMKSGDAAAPVINDGNWHHLAASFDRTGDVVMYQDGVELLREPMEGLGDINGGLPIQVAQDGTSNYGVWYEGQTGEPILFDYALSTDQITALYNE